MISFTLSYNFFFFLRRGGGGLFSILFTPIKIIIFSFDALRPRGGPYFLPLQKVGKDRRKGVSPPCESPDQSGVLDAPLWKPPSPRWRGKFSRTPSRFAAGASVPLGKAASACALASAAAPPPLRLGACAPWPPASPVRERLPVMRACWGLAPPCPLPLLLGNVCRSCAPVGGCAPLPPAFPRGGRLPVMRACWELTPPGPLRSPEGDVCRSCAQRMGQRSLWLLRQRLRKSPGSSCREAARSSVTPLARLWPQATLARPPAGESQRGRSPLWPVFAYFLLARK